MRRNLSGVAWSAIDVEGPDAWFRDYANWETRDGEHIAVGFMASI